MQIHHLTTVLVHGSEASTSALAAGVKAVTLMRILPKQIHRYCKRRAH